MGSLIPTSEIERNMCSSIDGGLALRTAVNVNLQQILPMEFLIILRVTTVLRAQKGKCAQGSYVMVLRGRDYGRG